MNEDDPDYWMVGYERMRMGMKVIVAGCRHITDIGYVEKVIEESGFKIAEIVSGKAPGVDSLGEIYASAHGIPVKEFPADWERWGRAAGPIRNNQMAQYADALVAVWDGKSPGTKHMIGAAEKMGLHVHVYIIGKG